jgi:hypothetical protein
MRRSTVLSLPPIQFMFPALKLQNLITVALCLALGLALDLAIGLALGLALVLALV